MVRNPIVLRVARTTLVWWLALTTLTFTSFELIGHATDVDNIVSRLLLALAGFAAATAIVAASTLARRELVRRQLLQGERRGLTTAIGPVPEGLGVPARSAGSRVDIQPGHPLQQWAVSVKSARPELYRLYEAAIDTFAANPDCPAAPVSTGHGGRTLFEHSLVVVEQVAALAPGFTYDGGRNKQGHLVAPILDPNFRFDPQDPLIVLIALVHDIGKSECYQRDPETRRIEEVQADHDRVGRMMLARMPEIWDLEREDRQTLLYAVGYYHHPQELPRFVDDRARALMELLIVADKAAGTFETAHPLWRASPVASPGWPTPAAPAAAAGAATAAKNATDRPRPVALEAPSSLAISAQAGGLPPARPEFAAAGLDAVEAAYVDAFLALLALPEAVNGKLQRKLAWRWDNLLYFAEMPLRRALARQLGEPALAEQVNGEGRCQLIEDLMRALIKLGLLYHQHDGWTYSEKRALFFVRYLQRHRDENGALAYNRINEKYDSKATVIVKVAGPIARLVPDGNCSLMPKIERPTFSEKGARNKKDGPVQAESESDDASPQPAEQQPEAPAIEAASAQPANVGLVPEHSMPASEAPHGVGQEDPLPEPPSVQPDPTPAAVSPSPRIVPSVPLAPADAAAGALLALVEAARDREHPAPPPTLPLEPMPAPDPAELRRRIDRVDGPAGWVVIDGVRYRGRAVPHDQVAAYAGLVAALEADTSGQCRVIRQPDAVLLLVQDLETHENARSSDLTAVA